MKARVLLCVCGAAATAMTASVLAQSNTNPPASRPDATRQPETRPDTRPTTTDRRDTAAVPSVLQKMEGVWKVEVSCNESWMKSGHMDKTKEPMTPPEASRPGAEQPATNRTPSNDPVPGTKSFTGYAERKLVLGDNILQETIVLPDMMLGEAPDTTRNPSMPANHEFRGMSFLSFNEPSGTYRAVFMDSKRNDMHVDSGSYDASNSRIVFHGTADHDDAGSDHSGTQPGTKSDPADLSRQPATDHDMKTKGTGMGSSHFGNVRVVVEIIGDDKHQVTMYRGDKVVDADRPGTPRTADPKVQPSDPANRDQKQPDDMKNLAAASDNIVYRAIYTRATGAEATRFQRLINEDRALTRATPAGDR